MKVSINLIMLFLPLSLLSYAFNSIYKNLISIYDFHSLQRKVLALASCDKEINSNLMKRNFFQFSQKINETSITIISNASFLSPLAFRGKPTGIFNACMKIETFLFSFANIKI